MQSFLLNNYDELSKKVGFEHLINELPSTLKEEMIFYQFGKLINQLEFFETIRDNDCIWAILSRLSRIKYDFNQQIYAEGEPGEIIYFIHSGKVVLKTWNGFVFKTFKSG